MTWRTNENWKKECSVRAIMRVATITSGETPALMGFLSFFFCWKAFLSGYSRRSACCHTSQCECTYALKIEMWLREYVNWGTALVSFVHVWKHYGHLWYRKYWTTTWHAVIWIDSYISMDYANRLPMIQLFYLLVYNTMYFLSILCWGQSMKRVYPL